MAKKYYWLKLKSDFFTSRAMKKLRRMADGDTYTIIYLKLQLLSLKDKGYLYFDGFEATFYEEMALALDEDEEKVNETLVFLEKAKLIEKKSETEYFLPEVPILIGGEDDSAERVRRFREKKKQMSNEDVTECNVTCNADVTECNVTSNTDIEIDKDIEKDLERDKEINKRREEVDPYHRPIFVRYKESVNG